MILSFDHSTDHPMQDDTINCLSVKRTLLVSVWKSACDLVFLGDTNRIGIPKHRNLFQCEHKEQL